MRRNGRNRQWERYGAATYRKTTRTGRFFRGVLWYSVFGTLAYAYVLFWLAGISRF